MRLILKNRDFLLRRLCSLTLCNLLLLLVFCSTGSNAQNLPPVPVPGGTLFRYANNSIKLTSVAISGPFNNWQKRTDVFIYNKQKDYWEAVVKLRPGVEHFYKLVLNDSLWITDPSAPDVTEDEWRNGIIIPQEYGAPFVVSQFPPRNKRVEKIPEVSFTLKSNEAPIKPSSVKLLLNNKTLKSSFNAGTNTVTAKLPKNLGDGEHTMTISFSDNKGNANTGYETKFFLDRFIQHITTPAVYDSSVMYEVFIRKFKDSNGDGIGDFNGLTSKLGYLADTLGVHVLWLMPFNPSPTEHGYSVTDYFSIEPALGTFSDYLHFLKEAKKHNIRVLMDFVINHTDSLHPFFLSAYKNPKSRYSSWFQFVNKENSDWKHFGVERKMPKLDFKNKEVQDYFLKVAKYWIDPNGDGNFEDGVDGFRCDAAKEVPHTYWNRFRKYVKGLRSDLFLLGEVWDNARYLIPFFKEEFDALFDYPKYYAFQELTRTGDVAAFTERINILKELYPSGHQLVRFLSNHDNPRPVNFAGSYERFVQGLGLIFSMPGVPLIYYGDELGYTGTLPPENVRQNFDWEKLNNKDETFVELYRDLINVRRNHPVLWKRNDKKVSSLDFLHSDYGSLILLRYDEKSAYIVIANLGTQTLKDISAEYTGSADLVTQGNFTPVFEFKAGTSKFGAFKIQSFTFSGTTLTLNNVYLEPGGFAIIKLR